jgi:hypothetical protein
VEFKVSGRREIIEFETDIKKMRGSSWFGFVAMKKLVGFGMRFR